MLGMAGGFIGYYLMMAFFLVVLVPPVGGWEPFYGLVSSEPHTLLIVGMPILFVVAARTISPINRRYLVLSVAIGAIHLALLMSWPFMWWV